MRVFLLISSMFIAVLCHEHAPVWTEYRLLIQPMLSYPTVANGGFLLYFYLIPIINAGMPTDTLQKPFFIFVSIRFLITIRGN